MRFKIKKIKKQRAFFPIFRHFLRLYFGNGNQKIMAKVIAKVVCDLLL